MPHIDELLGVATLAAAGMFAAIAVQPLANDVPHAASGVRSGRPAASAAKLAAAPMRAFAQKFDAWLEARERAAADRETLANMSDRELQDIGLDRARADFMAVGMGMHDYPY